MSSVDLFGLMSSIAQSANLAAAPADGAPLKFAKEAPLPGNGVAQQQQQPMALLGDGPADPLSWDGVALGLEPSPLALWADQPPALPNPPVAVAAAASEPTLSLVEQARRIEEDQRRTKAEVRTWQSRASAAERERDAARSRAEAAERELAEMRAQMAKAASGAKEAQRNANSDRYLLVVTRAQLEKLERELEEARAAGGVDEATQRKQRRYVTSLERHTADLREQCSELQRQCAEKDLEMRRMAFGSALDDDDDDDSCDSESEGCVEDDSASESAPQVPLPHISPAPAPVAARPFVGHKAPRHAVVQPVAAPEPEDRGLDVPESPNKRRRQGPEPEIASAVDDSAVSQAEDEAAAAGAAAAAADDSEDSFECDVLSSSEVSGWGGDLANVPTSLKKCPPLMLTQVLYDINANKQVGRYMWASHVHAKNSRVRRANSAIVLDSDHTLVDALARDEGAKLLFQYGAPVVMAHELRAALAEFGASEARRGTRLPAPGAPCTLDKQTTKRLETDFNALLRAKGKTFLYDSRSLCFVKAYAKYEDGEDQAIWINLERHGLVEPDGGRAGRDAATATATAAVVAAGRRQAIRVTSKKALIAAIKRCIGRVAAH